MPQGRAGHRGLALSKRPMWQEMPSAFSGQVPSYISLLLYSYVLSMRLSMHLFFYPRLSNFSIYLFIYLTALYLSIHRSLHISIYLAMYLYLSMNLVIDLSLYVAIYFHLSYVNPSVLNHGCFIGGYSSNSPHLILQCYLPN